MRKYNASLGDLGDYRKNYLPVKSRKKRNPY